MVPSGHRSNQLIIPYSTGLRENKRKHARDTEPLRRVAPACPAGGAGSALFVRAGRRACLRFTETNFAPNLKLLKDCQAVTPPLHDCVATIPFVAHRSGFSSH